MVVQICARAFQNFVLKIKAFYESRKLWKTSLILARFSHEPLPSHSRARPQRWGPLRATLISAAQTLFEPA
jgi:hypothetical protein